MAEKIIDVKLVRDPITKIYDIAYGANGDFVLEEGFNTRILMVFVGEKRADESEVSQPSRRRGWVGNLNFDEGIENGTKLWLLSQARNTPEVLQETLDFARKGAQDFVDRGFADEYVVTGAQSLKGFDINIQFIVDNNVIENKSFNTWEKTLQNA